MVVIKGKVLLLVGILVIASVAVAGYQITANNSQLKQSNLANLQNQVNSNQKDNSKIQNEKSNNLQNQPKSNNTKNSNIRKDTTSKSNLKTPNPQSIAQRYIEEPNAVAGKPERYNIGGKSTDVVPVLLNGKRVGEIDIDPKTGKNVGGAGGAP